MNENRSADFTAIFFGAVFIGAWMYGFLFGYPFDGFKFQPWLLWGLLGLFLSGVIYAGMVATEVVRIIVLVIIGISSAIIFLSLILQEEAHMVATFVTMLGGGLIVYVLPRPQPKQWNQVE